MNARAFCGLAFGLILLFVITSNGMAITDPLKDENGLLIMTTRDYSNFASREYFDYLKINHSGVDLALSKDGSRVASRKTAGKTVYAICDGKVDFIHNTGGLYSFIKIRHPNCNGQDVLAYYGHITPEKGLETVTEGDPIGTVKNWGALSHLHLTIDTQTERDLSRINYVACNYTLDSNTQTVTSLSNCRSATRNPRELSKNEMLLRMGWGQVRTLGYKDSNGRLYVRNLYISENAMRELGILSFFDLSSVVPEVTILWSVLYDSGRSDWPYGIVVDSANNVIVTGVAVAYLNEDTLTLKYDPNGNLLWSKIYDIGSAEHSLGGVAIDSVDNIILGVTPWAVNLYDYHTVKYDPAGNILWVKIFDTGDTDIVTAVTTDSADNIIVIGYIHAVRPFQSPIVKYDRNGNILWTRNLPIYFQTGELSVDSHDNIIIAGSIYSESTGIDYYIAKLDPDGNVLWERAYNSGGAAYDYGLAVALDSNDNIIFTGDRITIKYTSDGDILWMTNDIGIDIAIDQNDNIVIASGATIKDLSPGGKVIGSGSVIKYLNHEGNLMWSVPCEDFLKGIVIDSNRDIIITSSTDPSPLGSGDFLITKLRVKPN